MLPRAYSVFRWGFVITAENPRLGPRLHGTGVLRLALGMIKPVKVYEPPLFKEQLNFFIEGGGSKKKETPGKVFRLMCGQFVILPLSYSYRIIKLGVGGLFSICMDAGQKKKKKGLGFEGQGISNCYHFYTTKQQRFTKYRNKVNVNPD